MTERQPEDPLDFLHPSQLASDAEFTKTWSRIEKLGAGHRMLSRAAELDTLLGVGGLTRSFLINSGGDVKYPFPHFRVKLKTKNREESDIKVAVLRYPQAFGGNLYSDKLYIAYEDTSGEHSFYLSPDQYSVLDPAAAFTSLGEGTVYEPNVLGLTRVQDEHLLALESLLGLSSDFEPDLQANSPNVAA